MNKLFFKNYEDVKKHIETDDSTSYADKEYMFGLIYGCYLCKMITDDEREILNELLDEIVDKNIEEMNNRGSEIYD